MSSGVAYFSSPPPAVSSNKYNHFYTPQHPKATWTTISSPSPLRSSININLMPNSQESLTKRMHEGTENVKTDAPHENIILHTPHNREIIDYTTPCTSSETSFSTPSIFLSSTTTTTSIPSVESHASRASAFQYQARARSSSPSVQLHNQTTSNRDSRKRLFLDRLRTKRDDERCERNGDQILRMDWVKEQRAREVELAMRSNMEADLDMDLEVDDDLVEQDLQVEEELSPTEDREMEELLSYLDPSLEKKEQSDDDFSDEDYDALFMEVMSQEISDPSRGARADEFGDMWSSNQHPPGNDTDMDMS